MLRVSRIPEPDNIDVVSIQLTDLDHIWWKNEEERLGAEPAAWAFFSEAVLAKFFTEMAKDEMERRFTRLV